MTYKIVLTVSAFADLENIKRYIDIDNPEEAKMYVSHIVGRLDHLSSFPYLGPSIANSIFAYAKARYLTCGNHVAVYQVDEVSKCVYVLRVLSHFQDWKAIANKDILHKKEVIIEDDVLSIVKMNQTMYFDVYRNSLDDDNRKYVPDEVFDSLEEASIAVDRIIADYGKDEGPFVYAVMRKRDDANMGYMQLAKTNEGWEIGYHIAKIYAGNGYATNALRLFLTHIKGSTQIKEVFAIVLPSNKASRRVLEKCGFQTTYEGNGLYQGKQRKIIRVSKHL